MSTDNQEMEMRTKPVAQHEWLRKLVGSWTIKSEMSMPDGSTLAGEGSETVVDFGGLWAFGEGKSKMPDGSAMNYRVGLGYDISFKEYRGFMIMDVSSHMWRYTGTLSADGNTMNLDCVGPDMMRDGETANYRDIIHFVDDNHRTLTSTGQSPDGSWMTFFKASYERV